MSEPKQRGLADQPFQRAAILFAGGPAPAANAVISTAAASFLRAGIDVVGIKHGYSYLLEHSPENPFANSDGYIQLDANAIKRTRNRPGILIGTARDNPGKNISSPDHLRDPELVKPLNTVYEALCSLGIDCLVSIGGDDTLKTANKLKLFQDGLPEGARRIPIVHVPKTIDNDYMGIDFTFGYFTAVDVLAQEIRNLLADAEASRSYFIVETMGRSAGWLAYGAAIAGEASLVISVEDIIGKYRDTEVVMDPTTKEAVLDENTGEEKTREIMNVEEVVRRIVATMTIRERRDNKPYGLIVIAEGLAERLPEKYLTGIPRDDFGHIKVSEVGLGKLFAKKVAAEYGEQHDGERKVTGIQLGYESRCARPNAFDVMLGSQLGVGAYRALVEERLNGVMVTVYGQLQLAYRSFEELVNPETLATIVRYIQPESDFHKLARFLETFVDELASDPQRLSERA